MKAHQYAPRYANGEIRFELRAGEKHAACTYCGSLTVADAIAAFVTPGTEWSGADWKYGWPHKLYITIPGAGPRKFYTEHLIDATDDELEIWNRVVAPITGLEFAQRDRDLVWNAVPGHQGHGVIPQRTA